MTGALLIQAGLPPLLLLLLWLTPALTAPTLPFGVRIPAERTREPVVAEQRRAYRRLVGVLGGVVTVAGVAVVLATASAAVSLLAALAVGAVGLAGYLRAHRAISAAKRHGDWYRGLRQVVVADTGLRTDPTRFPWPWAAPALLLPLGTAVAGVVRYPSMPDRLATHFGASGTVDHLAAKSVGSAFAPVLAQLVTTAVILLVSRLAFRARPDLDPARVRTTVLQHRRYLVLMARTLLLLAGCVDLTALLAAWRIWDGARTLTPLPLLAPTLLGLAVTIGTAVRCGQNGSRLRVVSQEERAPQDERALPGTGEPLTRQDDDRHWRLGGLAYVNRRDPAFLVPKRFGVGWTVNYGSPYTLLLLAVLVGFAVAMPLLTR
ncbi:DUF5808 domain-containing protein [Kitasatospora nipponensis]|uniref:DUF5808 domain-containing protein n=1 Tax=Kitasatospora nipponensis TaxID=258049 RepID=A0ABN1WXY4_9ACTN